MGSKNFSTGLAIETKKTIETIIMEMNAHMKKSSWFASIAKKGLCDSVLSIILTSSLLRTYTSCANTAVKGIKKRTKKRMLSDTLCSIFCRLVFI